MSSNLMGPDPTSDGARIVASSAGTGGAPRACDKLRSRYPVSAVTAPLPNACVCVVQAL